MSTDPEGMLARITEFYEALAPVRARPARIELGPVAMERLLATVKSPTPDQRSIPWIGSALEPILAVPLVDTDELGDRGWRMIAADGQVMSAGVWELTTEEQIEELAAEFWRTAGERLRAMKITPSWPTA